MFVRKTAVGAAILVGLSAAATVLGAGPAAADKDGYWIPVPPPGHIGQILHIPPGHLGQIVGVPPGQWDKAPWR
jgi:hypothetical protein